MDADLHFIKAVNPQGEDALSLLREAAIEARAMYPELHTEGAPWPSNAPTPPGGTYLVLAALEREAVRMGYKAMRLETGNRQQPAMALYESYGFKRIAPFGEYANDPTSVCYEKGVAKYAGANG